MREGNLLRYQNGGAMLEKCPKCGRMTFDVIRELGNPNPVDGTCRDPHCNYHKYFGSIADNNRSPK